MLSKWFVLAGTPGNVVSHCYDYNQNAMREYYLLMNHPQTLWLVLIHYDGETVELVKQKKLK